MNLPGRADDKSRRHLRQQAFPFPYSHLFLTNPFWVLLAFAFGVHSVKLQWSPGGSGLPTSHRRFDALGRPGTSGWG